MEFFFALALLSDINYAALVLSSRFLKMSLQDEEVVRMDRLRWHGAPLRSGTFDGWGWLDAAIDFRRVQATISDYPLHDGLRPPQLPDDSLLSDAFTSDRSTDFAKTQLNSSDGQSKIYSPGFLLPLIFCALEDDEFENTSSSNSLLSLNRFNSTPNRNEGAQLKVALAQRLCEKGCLALALASLCSPCNDLRRVAVAIIELFSILLGSEEARDYTTWRERPQIYMLVKSIQRAIAIHKAEKVDHHSSIVQVPGFSAIFLARSCLVLARPSDSIFPQINRIFLQSEDDHGAFQELARLPAFVSLFCSSADDPGLSWQQRLWAVRLVKDGMLDESCYKALVSCHAPELLLSSIENCRLYNTNDRGGEACLLLQTMHKVLAVGGQKCVCDLIGRLGLLSWIQSVLEGRQLFEILPTITVRLAFLDLVYVAVTKAPNVLPEEELYPLIVGLAQPILQVWLHNRQTKRLGDKESESNSLLLSVCETLCVMGRLVVTERWVESVSFTGLSLSSVLSLLEAAPAGLDRHNLMISLNRFPVAPLVGEDSRCLGDYCRLVLKCLLVAEARTLEWDLALKRLSFLFCVSKANVNDDRGTIVDQLLELRHRFCINEKTYLIWMNCLEALSACGKYPREVTSIVDEILAAQRKSYSYLCNLR